MNAKRFGSGRLENASEFPFHLSLSNPYETMKNIHHRELAGESTSMAAHKFFPTDRKSMLIQTA